MNDSTARQITPAARVDASPVLPPSKSYTNRALIAAALADGTSTIIRPSASDDTALLLQALREFGVNIGTVREGLEIRGTGGNLRSPRKEIFVGNAGTAMRFLCAFALLAPGVTVLSGDDHMKLRPIGDLLSALDRSGIRMTSNAGYPPVTISGGGFEGGEIGVKTSLSSQFASSILLSAPYAKRAVKLRFESTVSSYPYIDMTIHVMRSFGAQVELVDFKTIEVSVDNRYRGRDFIVEPDASAATYFLAAAAITGGRVTFRDLPADSLQGDLKFLDVLSAMGCKVATGDGGVTLLGARLSGITVDMNAMPDCVPSLAVVAAFAEGPTTIENVAHLRYKESNRLTALANELRKIGAHVDLRNDGIVIHPGKLLGASIETYDDHRIAMSFAVAGLRVKGISVTHPSCVSKSFPDFWTQFSQLEGKE